MMIIPLNWSHKPTLIPNPLPKISTKHPPSPSPPKASFPSIFPSYNLLLSALPSHHSSTTFPRPFPSSIPTTNHTSSSSSNHPTPSPAPPTPLLLTPSKNPTNPTPQAQVTTLLFFLAPTTQTTQRRMGKQGKGIQTYFRPYRSCDLWRERQKPKWMAVGKLL